MPPENPFATGGLWLRANLHTHTTGSDGGASPEDTAARYRSAGYDVLAITDHNVRMPGVETLSDKRMLVLPGQEMHPVGNRGIRYHLVALGLADSVEAREVAPQAAIDAAREQGALVFVAHPSWCALTSADVAELDSLAAVEVYNATCLRHGKPSSEALWDEILAAGRLLPAVATDDTHTDSPHFRGDFARAWTMIRAEERTSGAVLEALAAGRFYATEGPSVEDFRLEPDASAESGWCAVARFGPARAVSFLGFASNSKRYELAADDPDATEWSHPVAAGARYVRLVVEDADGRRAWTGALPVPEEKDAP